MITVRPAISLDCASMARLLNAIIAQGGTTALTKPVNGAMLQDQMSNTVGRAAWHVALNAKEEVVGFQWIADADYLPNDVAEIATFVEIGQTGLGIGSKLFDATKQTAKDLGFIWINANIRADNEGGLIYYQSRGFVDYDRIENYALADGQVVDKILKRYDL